MMAKIRSDLEHRSFKENQHIFRERETGDHAFIVDKGTVEITRQVGGDEIVLLGTVHKGGMFGEMSLIDNNPRMASARAVDGPVEVTVITREIFGQRLTALDPFSKALINILSSHVRSIASHLNRTGAVIS